MTTTTSPQCELLASRGLRIAAYLVDITIYWFIDIFTLIPILGAFIDIALLFYMLLRDFTGASIGKRAFGLRVMDNASGGPASSNQCIVRNLIFAVPLLVEWMPVFGFFIGSGFLAAIGFVELIMLLTMGRRLGDMIAGTKVIRVR